jgi:hypothetical protein
MELKLILIFLFIFLICKKTKESFVLKKDCLRLKGQLKNSPNSKQCGNYAKAAKKFYACGNCIRNLNIEFRDGDVCTTDPSKLDKALAQLNYPSSQHQNGKYLSKVKTECLMSGHCDGINTNQQVMEEIVKKCCGTYEWKGRWVKRKDENTTPDTYQYGAICNLTNAQIDDKAKLLKVL